MACLWSRRVFCVLNARLEKFVCIFWAIAWTRLAEENRYRHDSKKLADALVRLYYERNQMAESEPAPALPKPQEAGVG